MFCFKTSKKEHMDVLEFAVMCLIVNFSTALENEEGILMRVYEDDIGIQNHWEAILHCAVSYPNLVRENCTRMWWSHEIDRIRHVEENPEDRNDTYKIKTELIKRTTHLEILSFTEKVKGPYKCQAECGNHLYTITCEVQNIPHINQTTLCSEKIFKPNIPDTRLHVPHSQTNTPVLLGMTVSIGILGAVVLTGILRWLSKRRAAQKRFRQVLQELSRSPVQRQPLPQRQQTLSDSASHPRRQFQVRNVSLPPIPPTLFFNTTGQVPDQVVYQQMPDGSQIVFIPATKLPSYEDSVADDRHTPAIPRRLQSVLNSRARSRAPHTEAGIAASAGRAESPQLSEKSLPPSYRSLYGRLLDSDNSSERTSSSDDQNLEDQEETDFHEATSSRNTHPSREPLLSGSSDRSARLPSWMVGYPPPEYEDRQ